MEIIEILNIDGSIEKHVIIEREDGSFLSMPKSVYDAQQASLKDAAK